MFLIKENCVGCHNCYSECPMQAIDYEGIQYQIDQDKCVKCGLCAKVCHTQNIIDTEDDYVAPQHDLIIREADVVVCGAGTGLVGAVKAAQMGKKVILLEKAKVVGGNTDYAHGFFPVYTKWHEEVGMADCREEAIKHYDKATNGIIGEDIFRTAVYKTGEFFDWMCTLDDCHRVYKLVDLGSSDAHGPIFGPGLLDFFQRADENLNCRDDAIGPGWGGTYVKNTMMKAIEEQGLDVTIYTETAAEHLLLDENGAIRGVMARDLGGEVQINAPTVILACGGFGKADDLIAEFVPGFFEKPPIRFSVPTDTGDGIRMLRELGVEPDTQRMNVSMFGPKHHPFSNTLADYGLEPQMLQINVDGKRWINEEGHLFGMTAKIDEQPKGYSWSVQSADNWEKIANHYINSPQYANKKFLYEAWMLELEEETHYPGDAPAVIADTIEELAEGMRMPVDALRETIERYNEFCKNGVDEDFGKGKENLWSVNMRGPFYATRGQKFSEACMGGLMVDADCRVLRNDNTPIPGLYGVGDATGAMHVRGILAVVSELTWAVASSYASAENAVAYIDEKGGAK